MKKICPKCKTEFDCYPEDISKCHCSKVVLSKDAQKAIKKEYKDCLCNACLKKMADKYPV